MLNPLGYTLCQAWELLIPTLEATNDMENFSALVKWLCIVSTNSVTNDIMTAAIDLEIPLAGEKLITHRSRFLQQALPGLFQSQQSLELAIAQIAAAVIQNTNDSRIAHEEKAACAAAPLLPSEKYMAMIGILQEYLQIPDERNLPALWHQWANCTKKQEYNVLTDQLQTYASSPDAFSTNTPVASIKLVQNL
jgi:hypothetical protein